MKTISKIVIIILFIALFFLWFEIARSPKTTDGVGIYFLNVGQGDSELIQKGDYQILIDGGPDDSVLPEIGKIMPVWDRKIDTVILTHPHADHLTGINLILDRYEIGTIYSSGVLDTTNGYLEFLDKIKTKKLNFVVPQIGDQIVPFENADLKFLWPGDKYKEKSLDNLNNSSEVAKFCYFESCVLFTGDIEKDEQDSMIKYYDSNNDLSVFKSNIFKEPHHGSSNGLNEEWLKMIEPKYAVIEVGANNKYGHPHAVTLDTLSKLNIQILRTDRDGTIRFNLTKYSIGIGSKND